MYGIEDMLCRLQICKIVKLSDKIFVYIKK